MYLLDTSVLTTIKLDLNAICIRNKAYDNKKGLINIKC